MIVYPDASFLYGIYRPQSTSAAALAYYREMQEPLHVTDLLLFEFRQSLRFQAFRWKSDRSAGVGAREFSLVLDGLESDLRAGILVHVDCDLREVIKTADTLSDEHTRAEGYRAFDILHVATAVHLGARTLLSFDAKQCSLAKLAGLNTAPADS